MSQTTVYMLPLHHTDTAEYLRIRRGIDETGAKSVGFEFPKTPLSEYLMRDVLGKSGRNLGNEIEKALASVETPEDFMEVVMSDLEELDRAKHKGLINDIYPIDMDHSAESLASKAGILSAYSKREERVNQLMERLDKFDSFSKIATTVRDILLFGSEYLELRESHMAENIERIVREKGKLLIMTGSVHVPNIENMLRKDGIPVVKIEAPEKVSGVWWLAYSAALDARASADKEGHALGKNLLQYSLLLSLTTLKAASQSRGITDEEASAIKAISSFKGAEKLYDRMQNYYRNKFEESIPILGAMRD